MWEQERVAGLGTGGAYVEFFVIPKAVAWGLSLCWEQHREIQGMNPQGKHSFPRSTSNPSCSSPLWCVPLGAASPVLYSHKPLPHQPLAVTGTALSSQLGPGYPWICPWSPEELCLHPRAQLALEQAEELGGCLGTGDVIPRS